MMKMSKIQFIASLLLFTAVIGLGISYGPVYLFHILALIFSVFLIIRFRATYQKFKIRKAEWKFEHFIYLMIAWYALTMLWSKDLFLSLYYLFYLINALIIIFAFQYSVNTVSDMKRVLKIITFIFIFEMLLSLLEGFSGLRWPISPYSDLVSFFNRSIAYDANMSADLIAAIKSTPTGFRWNPNNLATTMLLLLPFFLFSPKILIRVFATIAALVIIFLTGSRGVLIAVFVLSVFYVFMFQKRKNILIIMSIATLMFLGFLLMKPYLKENYSVKYREISTTTEALNNYFFVDHEQINDTSSIAIRQNLISNGIDAFKSTYGLGLGAGNSQLVQKERGNTHNTYSMHNFWVELLVEGGIIFFLLWCIWYFLLIRKLFFISRRHYSSDIRYYAKSATLSLIVLMIGMISISSAIYFFPMWLLFAFSFVSINLAEKGVEAK